MYPRTLLPPCQLKSASSILFRRNYCSQLSIKFGLFESMVFVERGIIDPAISLASMTLQEISSVVNGSTVWELGASKYRVYGFLIS